jgi:mono/diheme cytochrome c family protein
VIKQTRAMLLLVSIASVASSVSAQDQGDGKRMYEAYCTGCHGASGKGDGPAAKTLPVKPADHTRAEMNKHTDKYLADIISKGGASVGKSAQMPAWGAVIEEARVKEIVAHIRTLSNGKKEKVHGTVAAK